MARSRGRMSLRYAGLLLLVTAAACDADLMAAGPVTLCREVASQCQLPEGPLGVCERAPCNGDAAPPCFVCTPQH